MAKTFVFHGFGGSWYIITLPKNNSSPVKMGLLKRKVVFQPSTFRFKSYVSVRVGDCFKVIVGLQLWKFQQHEPPKTTSISCTFLHHNNNNNNNNNQQQITNAQKPPYHLPKEWPHNKHPGYLCCCSGLIHHKAEPCKNVVFKGNIAISFTQKSKLVNYPPVN